MTEGYLPLGCFGKLPCDEEYLEVNVAYPTSRALREWMFRGREGVGAEESGEPVAAPEETARRRFLMGLHGSGELLAGVIRPSADRQERRRFPFAAFAHLPRRPYGKAYPLLPLALEPVWEALDDAWDNLAGVASREAFFELARSTRVPGPASPEEARAAYQGLQRESVGRMFDGEEARLEDLLARLPDVIARLRERGGAERLRLELPVSSDLRDAGQDTGFWLDLLNRQFFLRRFEPAVFMETSAREKGRHVLLVFGAVTPPDYPLVMGCRGGAVAASRPARPAAGGAAATTPPLVPPRYEELLARRFSGGSGGARRAPEAVGPRTEVDRAP